jgi:hypothetical protein
MLNFFNNIKKIDDNDNDDDVKEHYTPVRYNPGGDNVSKILYGLFLFFSLVVMAIELWEQTKPQKLIKTNNVVNGSVPVLPTVSTAPVLPTVSTAPAVPVLPKVPVVPVLPKVSISHKTT